MRERTTWNRTEIVKLASMAKTADPYTMNQDHKNPPTSKYQNGDPSSWGEDVHSPNEWDKEYANGQTKRNEIGMPEMRADSQKNASDQTLLVKKADLCVKVARAMLGKKASEEVVEDQAVAFMALDDSALIDTFNRLANDDQQGQQAQEEPKQAQQEQQQEQAAPPAQEQQAAQQQQEQQAAPQQQTAAAKAMAAMQSGDQEGMKAALQQMVQEAMQQAPAQQAQGQQMQASKKKKAQDEQAQQGQSQDQKQAAPQMDLSAMVQQEVQAQLAQQQAPAQQQAAQDPMQSQSNDQMLLDEMLAAPDAPMDMGGAGDIELEPSEMDVGGDLGPEDADLKMLFATQETQDAEQAQQAQEKQASVRTASTRTVGTKPTAGVSRVGGFGQTKTASAGSNDVDKLSNLWATAPDVKEHFGIK